MRLHKPGVISDKSESHSQITYIFYASITMPNHSNLDFSMHLDALRYNITLTQSHVRTGFITVAFWIVADPTNPDSPVTVPTTPFSCSCIPCAVVTHTGAPEIPFKVHF